MTINGPSCPDKLDLVNLWSASEAVETSQLIKYIYYY